jgi:hypothetical protein
MKVFQVHPAFVILHGRDVDLVRSSIRHHNSCIVHFEDWLPALVPNSPFTERLGIRILCIVTELFVVFALDHGHFLPNPA